MTRAEAKESAKRKRRQAEEEMSRVGCLSMGGETWTGRYSAHTSLGVLHHMTEDDEAAGLSWDTFRPE